MILQYALGLLGSNCYLVFDCDGGEGALIDPGVNDTTPLMRDITAHDLRIRYILNTHGHFDHIAGNGRLDLPEVKLGIHPDDRHLMLTGGGAATFGLPHVTSPEPELALTEGTELPLGNLTLRMIHTPGHTPGSICIYVPGDASLFTGDTLFASNVGRTDLPGGDPRTLTQSLARLLELPAQTRIYPGHGPTSTLHKERHSNPWMRRLL